MMKLKGTVAGRFRGRWEPRQLTSFGLPSLQNCAMVVVDNPVRPFTWAFELLMLGCGRLQHSEKNVDKLPIVREELKLRSI